MGIIKQSQDVVWIQSAGQFTPFVPYATGEGRAGLSGKSIPIVGITPEYGVDNYGNPLLLQLNETAPGDLPTLTLAVFDREFLTALEELYHNPGRLITLHERKVNCGTLDNPNQWSKIHIWSGGKLTAFTPGDGPSVTFNGESMQQQGQISFPVSFILARTGLSSLTTTEADDLVAIVGIPDNPPDCGTGYPGRDQILYIASGTDGATPSALIFSRNGGGSWAATSNAPFGAATDGLSALVARVIDDDSVRVVVGNGAAAKWAYGDAVYGDEGGMTWTEITIAAGAASAVTAMFWPSHRRGYAANGGDIFISEDGFTSDPGAAAYTGANDFNDFAKSPDGRTIWAVGASNTIVREVGESGTFEARVGPSAGGDFHSIAVADDGTIFAGNDQYIYRSRNQAANTGGWEQVYDAGADHTVVKIQCVRGDSQTLRAVVDDTTPGDGSVVESLDGGENWRELTQLANEGYNDAYFSDVDPNLAVLVGDTDTVGQIHRLAPTS